MTQRDRQAIEADERTFFAEHYTNQGCNLTGARLHHLRELKALHRLSGRRRFGRLLSLGCGAGDFELLLARSAEHVTAIDLSPEAIEAGRRKAREAGITNIDFECTSLADLRWGELFDGIICLSFLHHVPAGDVPSLLEQVYRHLQPSGFFYSLDPNVHGAMRSVGRVILGDGYHKYHTPDERELDPKEVAASLEQAGFAAVEIGYLDVTVIPGSFMLARQPGWPMYLFAAVDWLWCHSPLAPWASGFVALAHKADGTRPPAGVRSQARSSQ